MKITMYSTVQLLGQQTLQSAGDNVKKSDPLCIAIRNVKMGHQLGNQAVC